MKSILLKKEFPYFFTVLLGLLGYLLNEFSEKILDTPYIEYEFHEPTDDYFSYIITNVSTEETYSGLQFTITCDDSLNFKIGGVIFQEPVYQQKISVLDTTKSDQIGKKYAHFSITSLIPGSSLELRVYYIGKITKANKPKLLFNLDKMEINQVNFSDPPVYLRKSGLLTNLAKNKLTLYLFLIGLWASIIFMYILFLNKNHH